MGLKTAKRRKGEKRLYAPAVIDEWPKLPAAEICDPNSLAHAILIVLFQLSVASGGKLALNRHIIAPTLKVLTSYGE